MFLAVRDLHRTSGLRALPVTHLAFARHADATFSRSTTDGRAPAGGERQRR